MMGNNETRLIATFLVWLAFTVMMVVAMATGTAAGSGPFFLIGFAMLITAVALSTQAIWKFGGSSAAPAEAAEKAKRHSQVDRLLDKMDESELNELRARLMAESDGEAVSLEDLLAERERQRR